MGKNVCGGVSTRRVMVCGVFVAFALLAPSGAPPPAPQPADAATLPSGFTETTVFSGLTNPTVVRFAGRRARVRRREERADQGLRQRPRPDTDGLRRPQHDGRTPDNVLATTCTTSGTAACWGWRCIPNFPTTPYVYVLYTYDHAIGGTAPRWGTPARLGRLPESARRDLGRLRRQRPSLAPAGRRQRHDRAGAGAGRGLVPAVPEPLGRNRRVRPRRRALRERRRRRELQLRRLRPGRQPAEPLRRPARRRGRRADSAHRRGRRAAQPGSAHAPATRSRSTARSSASIPRPGAALPSNPLAGSSDPNARRIIAYGLRNPFRFAFRPGTSELWIGDVGWNEWEEINRIPNPTDAAVENFGWPCYEGNPRQPGYDAADLAICESLYATPERRHEALLRLPPRRTRSSPGETCPTGSSSIAGLAFEFAPQGNELSRPSTRARSSSPTTRATASGRCGRTATRSRLRARSETFVAGAANPVNIEFGPDGNLYYVDFDGGTIRRVAPVHAASAGTTYLSDLTWTLDDERLGPASRRTSPTASKRRETARRLTLNGDDLREGPGRARLLGRPLRARELHPLQGERGSRRRGGDATARSCSRCTPTRPRSTTPAS